MTAKVKTNLPVVPLHNVHRLVANGTSLLQSRDELIHVFLDQRLLRGHGLVAKGTGKRAASAAMVGVVGLKDR